MCLTHVFRISVISKKKNKHNNINKKPQFFLIIFETEALNKLLISYIHLKSPSKP